MYIYIHVCIYTYKHIYVYSHLSQYHSFAVRTAQKLLLLPANADHTTTQAATHTETPTTTHTATHPATHTATHIPCVHSWQKPPLVASLLYSAHLQRERAVWAKAQ